MNGRIILGWTLLFAPSIAGMAYLVYWIAKLVSWTDIAVYVGACILAFGSIGLGMYLLKKEP